MAMGNAEAHFTLVVERPQGVRLGQQMNIALAAKGRSRGNHGGGGGSNMGKHHGGRYDPVDEGLGVDADQQRTGEADIDHDFERR